MLPARMISVQKHKFYDTEH